MSEEVETNIKERERRPTFVTNPFTFPIRKYEVISEYYRDPKKCCFAILKDFEKHKPKFDEPFQIEVPPEQYDEVLLILNKTKIAEKYNLPQVIMKGRLSFEQTKRLVRLGKIVEPLVRYNESTHSIRVKFQYALSYLIFYSLLEWGHETVETGSPLPLGISTLKDSAIVNSGMDFEFDNESPLGMSVKLIGFSIFDVTRSLLGQTTYKQGMKNVGYKAGKVGMTVAGAQVGGLIGVYIGSLALPVVGTSLGLAAGAVSGAAVGAAGAIAGATFGMKAGGVFSKRIMDKMIVDDIDRMFLILASVIQDVSKDYFLTKDEVSRLCRSVRVYEGKLLKKRLLKMRKEVQGLVDRKLWIRGKIVRPFLKKILQARKEVRVGQRKDGIWNSSLDGITGPLSLCFIEEVSEGEEIELKNWLKEEEKKEMLKTKEKLGIKEEDDDEKKEKEKEENDDDDDGKEIDFGNSSEESRDELEEDGEFTIWETVL